MIERSFRMKARTMLATFAGRFAQWGLKTFSGGGSSYPGQLATKIDPNILSELGKEYKVIVVTGTNGKTVTTSLIVNILREKFEHVMTNDTGSNMVQGLITSFILDAGKGRKQTNKIAVLEVDEASLRNVTNHIKPELIVVTNVFPDQVERYSSIEKTYEIILEGVNKTPESILLLNGDAPTLNSVDTVNPRQYFGFSNKGVEAALQADEGTEGIHCPTCGETLHYNFISYSNLGDYYCRNCGFKRPELNYQVDEVTDLSADSVSFTIADYDFTLPLAGLYNVYNALSAYSVARHIGINEETIAAGFAKQNRLFGRQEILEIGDKKVELNLIKNPVGLNQVIELILGETEPYTLITVLNDNPADGKDISWIEAGDFEKLVEMPIVKNYYAGIRKEDLNKRLVQAGFKADELIALEDDKEILEAIKTAPTEKVYLLTTYTALLSVREIFVEQGFIKDRMQA